MSLGKIAYEAYGNSVGWKTVNGTTMPSWDSQFDRLKTAWEDAAQAVHEEVLKDKEDSERES